MMIPNDEHTNFRELNPWKFYMFNMCMVYIGILDFKSHSNIILLAIYPTIWIYMEVSNPWGYPQFSSILVRFSTINHPAIGVPLWLWKPPNDRIDGNYISHCIPLSIYIYISLYIPRYPNKILGIFGSSFCTVVGKLRFGFVPPSPALPHGAVRQGHDAAEVGFRVWQLTEHSQNWDILGYSGIPSGELT